MASSLTPKRVYCKTNICVVCGFSFIQKEITETGEEIVKKYLKDKLRLNEKRRDLIRKAIGVDVGESIDNLNGICSKCWRKIEKVEKLKDDSTKERELLLESRKRVEQFQLTLPSPSKVIPTIKRLLPSTSTGAKETTCFKAFKPLLELSLIKKVHVKPAAELLLVNTATSKQRTILPKDDVGKNKDIQVCGACGASRVPLGDTKTPKSAKRALGFTSETSQKENMPSSEYNVEVTLYQPGGTRSTFVRPEYHKRVCKAVSRGKSGDRSIMDAMAKEIAEEFVMRAAAIVREECKQLCKRGSGSILQKKDFTSLMEFSLDKLYAELKERCPCSLIMLDAFVANKPPSPDSKEFAHMMLAAAIALHARLQEMSLFQYLLGFVLTHGGCTQRNIQRLSFLGITTGPPAIHRKLLSWTGELDKDLLLLRDIWASGGQKKFQLIGDNWDNNILPSYQTSDRKTMSIHVFNIYAAVDRIIPQPSLSFTKPISAADMDNDTFIPSKDEQSKLKEELTFLFSRSIITNLEQMETAFKGAYPQHLQHKYSHLAGQKTTQYPLGLFDCNENKTNDVIQLLKQLSDIYVPCAEGEIVESVFFGGDRLTDERVQCAQNAMRNYDSPKKRLEGFISKTEDFHRLMNFLEAIHKMTYSPSSRSDRGTAFFYKNMLDLRKVKGDVRNAYRPYKLLYYTILGAICVLLFLAHFGITNTEELIPLPVNFAEKTEQEKVQWLNNISSSIIEKWFFEDSEDAFQTLRNILSDKEHAETYWTANRKKDGRLGCHFCRKTFKHVGTLQTHEKKYHKKKGPIIKRKPKAAEKDELQDHVIMLFKLLMLHKNLDTAVDMADGGRSVRSAKYELPLYNRTNKTKYVIGSIHLTAMTSGLLPEEQRERLIWNRSVNVQGGKNQNIALDEFIEMLNRDSKIACHGYKTKESILKHSKEYPNLTHAVKHFDSICSIRSRKGFHHLPSYRKDVLKVAKDLMDLDVLTTHGNRTLKSKTLVKDRFPFDGCHQGLSTMIHRHKPHVPFRRLRDRHV